MIVDAHLHVWRSDTDYPDPSATTVSPVSDVPLELLEQYMSEYGIDRAVITQPLYPGEDNSYVAGCAQMNPHRFATVCVVDPRRSDAASRLKYWVGERACRGLRLRPLVADEAACFGAASTFPIWEFAQEARIVVSVLCDFAHLGRVQELARRFSEVSIIIDHLAHPTDMNPHSCGPLLSLSECSNVVMKMSGFAYFGGAYPHDGCDQLVRAIYDRFGPRRMVWGSDFPHVLLQTGYVRALRWLERVCDFLDESDLALIMGANACRLYWDEHPK